MQQIYRRTPIRSVISIMLLCNFIEIALWHGFPPVNLLHIFRILFPTKSSGRLFLKLFTKYKGESEPSQTSKVDRPFCEKKSHWLLLQKKLHLGCFTGSEYAFITKQNHIITFDTETIFLRLPWSQFFWHRWCLFCRKKGIKNKYLKKRPKLKLQVCLF